MWNTLLDRLASHPVTVAGTTVTKVVALDNMGNALPGLLPIPNLRAGWPGLAVFLHSIWAQANGAANALPVKDFTSSTLARSTWA